MIETIATILSGGSGVLLLCISAFLSATLLPGSSEAILTAAIAASPDDVGRAALLATAASLFNTAGSMTSWGIGRFLPDARVRRSVDEKTLDRLRRWGAPALFFAWVPIVGDAIPLAAGWLRVGFLPALFWTAAGKSFRYALLAWAAFAVLGPRASADAKRPDSEAGIMSSSLRASHPQRCTVHCFHAAFLHMQAAANFPL